MADNTPTLTDKMRTLAEFMGYKIYPDSTFIKPQAMNHIKEKHIPEYDTSWDALRPVWEKFRDEQQGNLMAAGRIDKIIDSLAYGTVSETFDLLFEAITWLNSISTNKQQNG